MQQSDIPDKFPLFWGANAGGGFIRNIPVASQIGISNGAASLADGFPPANFLPVGSGGVPPFGQDMNGIMRQMTQWLQWAEAGGPIAYDASFQASVGGYPKGAVVASALTVGLWWLSTVDSNVTNPDAGGAGWRRYSTSGGLIATRVFANSGVYTPTPGTQSIRTMVIGAGGGGGGCPAMTATQFASGGGGGSGGWAQSALLTGFAGVAITIGAGGAGGVGLAVGQSGALTSFGTAISITGGAGGAAGTASANPSTQRDGGGGVPTGGNLISSLGNAGLPAISFAPFNMVSGGGGASYLGAGGNPIISSTGNGNPGGGPGGGGSGSAGANSGAQTTGGAGANGLVIVEEFA